MVDKLGPDDVMAIVTDDVELLVDFTNDKQKLKKNLDDLLSRVRIPSQVDIGPAPRSGRSLQYSSLMATLNEAFIQEDLRPIIVFQTDGDQLYTLRDSNLIPSMPPDLPDDVRKRELKYLQGWLKSIEKKRLEFSLEDIHRTVEKSRATIYTVVSGYRVLDLT